MSTLQYLGRRLGTPSTIIFAALFAIAINLAVYGIGTLAGGTFDFTDKGNSYHVDALTLVGFTAVPLLVGLTLVAIVSRLWRWVNPVALVLAPIAAIGTIFTMTLPADLDTTSTVTLAITHVVVAIAVASGIVALRSPSPKSAFRFA